MTTIENPYYDDQQAEQQEKFEFLKQAALAGMQAHTDYPDVTRTVNEAINLLSEVWKHKGKL